MSTDDLLARLAERGGCARTADLVRGRTGERALAAAAAAGAVRRVGRGLYALPDAAREVVAARALGGRLTCLTVLAASGVPLLSRTLVPHVELAPHRGSRRGARSGVALHWASTSARSPVAGDADGVPHVAPAVALVHAVACLPQREAVAAVDAALRLRLVSRAEVLAARPVRSRRPVDDVLALVDGSAGSLPETFVRLALAAAGLRVQPQAKVPGVGRVDLLVEGCVVVEVDGYAFHSDRRAFAEDRRRDRAARAQGLIVLRYTFDEAVHGTQALVAEVLAHTAWLARR
ncbi:DUF559 domain-containing protein [Cellulomonas marina]|uniref:DUF559 domain-containing protein n=1 Tax=Cellulomonas marina TaxID=988821 RepID=A0A1I0X7P2_9CELL|nr:DUF559 domain-containing protein [Cellulomonas marina]GIG28952.1 hypothetical protein Cma02nite_15520 [Cellulomonas marina]SFA96033.1 Protein of unknown function [Cellulomonas marina]